MVWLKYHTNKVLADFIVLSEQFNSAPPPSQVGSASLETGLQLCATMQT